MSERARPSRAELEARKAFKPAKPQVTEHAKMEQAFHENRERLKLERMAREAAATPHKRK
jgi:hypothetical protein